MGTKLTNAPVFFTLAQVRFSKVLTISRELPELQQQLRSLGFVTYASVEVNSVELSGDIANGLNFKKEILKRHRFSNRERTASIVLDDESLSYEVSDYDIFDQFLKTFLAALDIAKKSIPIDFIERLGMRMLDVIQPDEGESIRDYVVPAAIGFHDLLRNEMTNVQSLTESMFVNGAHSVLCRAVIVQQGVAMPPDLSPLSLKLADKFTHNNGENLILDTDSSWGEPFDFDHDVIESTLAMLKSSISERFKAISTAFALDKWA